MGSSEASGRDRRVVPLGASGRGDRVYAFTGGAVTLFTISGPGMGKGRISIDGTTVETWDGYARTLVTGVTHRFSQLGPGPHTLTVQVLGTKRPAATGTHVTVDALRWAGQTHADPSPETVAWAAVTNPSASGGSYAVSDAGGAVTRLRFQGTGLSLRTLRGPTMGRAEIWVDGALVRVVDLYSAATAFATVRLAAGWSTDRTPRGSWWSARIGPRARGTGSRSTAGSWSSPQRCSIGRAPHGRGMFVRGVAREPHRRSHRPLEADPMASVRGREGDVRAVSSSVGALPGHRVDAIEAEAVAERELGRLDVGRIARPTAIAVESSDPPLAIPARDLGSLSGSTRP